MRFVVLFLSTLLLSASLASAGVLAHWNFDESDGNSVYDNSGNNWTGVLKGGVTRTQGKFGSALQFDGFDDYVDIPNSQGCELPGGFTLSAWVHYTSPSASVDSLVVGKHISAVGGGYFLSIAWGVPSFYVGCDWRLTAPAITDEENWHHLLGVYDGQVQYFYIDDMLISQQARDYRPDTDATIRIGGFFLGQYPGAFRGRIDEVTIYNSPVHPGLKLFFPNGSEQFAPGKTCKIEWNRTAGSGQVQLEYSLDNGQTWILIGSVDSTGTYDWLVPDVSSTKCLVRLSRNSESDTSDSTFAIGVCSRVVTGDLNGDCYVNFKDVAIVFSHWLECGYDFDPECSATN